MNGQQAVEVIKRYQDVVAAITEAERTDLAASGSISTTLQYVEQKTLGALQSNATTSKERSTVLEAQVNGRTTDAAGMNSSAFDCSWRLFTTFIMVKPTLSDTMYAQYMITVLILNTLKGPDYFLSSLGLVA